MLNDGFTPHSCASHVRIRDNKDKTLTVRLMIDSTLPSEKIVGMDCIGSRIFTRLSMDVSDFCAVIQLIEQVLGESPPDTTEAVAEGCCAGVELSADRKTATFVLQRPLMPEEADENGAPLHKTFRARVIRLHTCSKEIVITALVVDVRLKYESAWMLRNCFSSDLQQEILSYLAKAIATIDSRES